MILRHVQSTKIGLISLINLQQYRRFYDRKCNYDSHESRPRRRRRRGLAAALPLLRAGLLVGLGAVYAAVDEAPARKEGATEQADPAIFAREAPLVRMPVLAFVRHLTCGGFDVYALLPAMLCL